MFKIFSHTVLSLLLLIATTGMAVSKHYCGESLISVDFFEEAEPCCESGNCCHNETTFYQVDENFSAPVLSQLPYVTAIDLLVNMPGQLPEWNLQDVHVDFIIEKDLPPPPKIQTVLSLKQAWLL